MGLTYKENCPDIRNTKIIDMVKALTEYDLSLDIYDPWVDHQEVEREYGLKPVNQPELGAYDAVVLAIGHRQFKAMRATDIRQLVKPASVIYDLKNILPEGLADVRL